jgi:hypothetical protein
VHYVKPETCDPLHETAQGDPIGQIGAQGRRVRPDGDLAVVEFRAQRRARPAGESDLVCLCWHHGHALCVRWFISPASVPSGWPVVLTLPGVIRDPSRVPAVTSVTTGKPPRPVYWYQAAPGSAGTAGGGAFVAADTATRSGAERGARFARGKFLPPGRPVMLVARPALQDRLTAGAGQRLTVVLGSAGAGKSVLLSSWAAGRSPGVTSWLSCDEADANPVRFWTGFIEAARVVEPGFGADAADLLALDGVVSADLTASITNDAAKLPAGSTIIVDDFHYAATAVAKAMTDLVEHWPSHTAQLVLASRADPPLRLHRLRLAGELCELRDRDLHFSLAESGDLLANFGIQVMNAARDGLRRCRWPRCPCAAPATRPGRREPLRSAATPSPSTSSPRCWSSSHPRWPGSCWTRPSWAS